MKNPILTSMIVAALAISSLHADLKPVEKVAKSRIETLSKKDADYLGGTDISPYVSADSKVNAIKSLKGLYASELSSNSKYEVVDSKLIEDFAAVVLSTRSLSDPMDVKVYAVGLRKQKGKWKPMPLLGSFELGNFGYEDSTDKAISSLETWIEEALKKYSEKLQASARSSFNKQVLKVRSEMNRTCKKPEQVLEFFLRQCRKGDLAGVCAAIGMDIDSEENYYYEWDEIALSLIKGLNENGTDRGAWPLLCDENNVTGVVKVLEEDGAHIIGYGLLTPVSDFRVNGYMLAEFNLVKEDGRWHIRLPSELTVNKDSDGRFSNTVFREWMLSEEMRQFWKKTPSVLLKKLKLQSEKSIKVLQQKMMKAISEGRYKDWLSYHFLGEGDEEAVSTYSELARQWKKTVTKSGEMMIHLTMLSSEDKTLVLCVDSVVNAFNLSKVSITQSLYLKRKGGWHAVPEDYQELKGLSEEQVKGFDALVETLEKKRPEYSERAIDIAVGGIVSLKPESKLNKALSEDQVKKLVLSYRSLIAAKDLKKLGENVAVIDGRRKSGIRHLSYDIKGGNVKGHRENLIKVHAGKDGYAAVSLRLSNNVGRDAIYCFYIVVNTLKGPKVLVGQQMRAEFNRGDEILNTRNWRSLKDLFAQKEIDELKAMFKIHDQLSKEDVKSFKS